MVRAAPRRERRQPACARRLPRPREPRERGGRRRSAVLAAAEGAGERVAPRPRRDPGRPRRRPPRRAGGRRRAGAPLSRPAPRRRHGGELRLRALGLPDRDLGRRMGRDPRARLGRRPGGHPGSGVGAHLPAGGRGRRDLLGRGRRPVAPHPAHRGRGGAGSGGETRSAAPRSSRRSRQPVSTTSTSRPATPCRSTRPSSAGRMRGSCTAGGSGDRAAPLAQRALGGGRRPRRARGRRRRAAPGPGLVGRRRRLVRTGRDRRRDAPRATERPLRRPGRRDRQDRRRRACGRPGVGEPRPVVQAVPGVRHDAPRAGGNRPRRRGPVPLSTPVRHRSVHPRDGARAPRWEHTDGSRSSSRGRSPAGVRAKGRRSRSP